MSFTDTQTADLAAPLNRSSVKTRKQAGMDLSYVEGHHVIQEANRIFGFDAWQSETVELRCVSEGPRGDKAGVTYIARVRITVRAGGDTIIREGVGAGHGIDRDAGQAHEKAIKEAETDARKRSLMTFGNPFGLALYDKTQANVSDDTNTETRAPEQRPARQEPEPSAAMVFSSEKPAPVDPKKEALDRQTQHATRTAELQKAKHEDAKRLFRSHSTTLRNFQDSLDRRDKPFHAIRRDWETFMQTLKASAHSMLPDDQRILRGDVAEVLANLKHAEKFETVAA